MTRSLTLQVDGPANVQDGSMTRMLAVVLAGVFAGLTATATSLAAPRPVRADCDGPFPEFGDLVRSAKTIVIGDVVAIERGGAWDPLDEGVSSRFSLQIAHVVRGSSHPVVRIDDMPTTRCASVIGARLGDRIALAVDGSAFDRSDGVNMVAWIDAVPPPGFGPRAANPADTFSVEDVFALVGRELPAPQSAEGAPAEATSSPLTVLGVLAVSLVGVVVVAALLGRRRHAGDIGAR